MRSDAENLEILVAKIQKQLAPDAEVTRASTQAFHAAEESGADSAVRSSNSATIGPHLTGAGAASGIGIAATTRTRQHESGNPPGLCWFATSSSLALASQTRTSDACGLMQLQHGNQRRSATDINSLFQLTRGAGGGGTPGSVILVNST